MADRDFLEWPFFEDHHRQLAAELDRWAERAIPPITDADAAHDDVDQTCRKLVTTLGEAGWLRYCIPGAQGGMHDTLDVRSLCLIREILAYHSGLADFAFAMQGLGSGAISLFGTDAQKADILPDVASGRKIAAFALSEPEAGSDVAAMTTQMQRFGDAYVVNGVKTWISNGGIADVYTLFARTGEGNRGISAVIIPADTPGFEVAERIQVMAPHPLARLEFKDAKVSASHRLGEEGDGMKAALATLDVFRTTVGAAALGLARRALDEATGRALSRKMFGATLSDLPLAQAHLAEMDLSIETSALLIYRSAWTRDVLQKRVTREAAMAKLHGTDSAQTVIDEAVQLFGGLGVTSGQKVEELYREIRALRIYEGASDVQRIVIARQHLKRFIEAEASHA